ncbi:hypothetical protein ACTU3I_07285 [Microbacterium sp. RD1]|uniref:hypothetical protein n=1 Tax=Microbacterium sp. RD1 TaxID=3457313 RepID=UPI003FA5B8D9
MSDDIPRERLDDAEASDGHAAEVPAGGRGADTGAADATRIDDSDRAPVQNISTQNDIPGVGTRNGDGSMASGFDVRHRRSGSSGSSVAEADSPDRPVEPAPSLAQEYEPGVDPAHARGSRAAGPAASDGDPGSPDDRPDDRLGRVADKTGGSMVRIVIGGVIGLIAVVLFAFAVPVAPAVAWIGIALEVALFAVLAVSAGVLRSGRYRRLSVTVASVAMLGVGIVFGAVLLVLALTR